MIEPQPYNAWPRDGSYEEAKYIRGFLSFGERALLRRRSTGGPLSEKKDDAYARELRLMGLLRGWALTDLGKRVAPFCVKETKKRKARAAA